MYAYDRSTQEMIWANRAYEPARKRLANACKDKSISTPIYGQRGHDEMVDAMGMCYNAIVSGLGALNFQEWKEAAMACNDVYDLDFYPMGAADPGRACLASRRVLLQDGCSLRSQTSPP